MGILRLMMICYAAQQLAACGEVSRLPESAGFGPRPTLPAPTHTLLPTVNVAPAVGWPPNAKPVAGKGLAVNAFADGLDHPRWLYTLPNGDVLVAETNAPPKDDSTVSVKRWFMKLFMKRAGAGVPSANRITLLRDANGDGVAEMRSVFLAGLNSPFGMTLVGNTFYVANTDAVVRFPYQNGETKILPPGEKVVDLPAGKINHHWTKNIIANADGSRLYVTVGSNSNVGENGLENEINRAAILEINPQTGDRKLFASGLRNPNGLAWQPGTGLLWTTVNERDEIGSDLVPDYLTPVREGDFYGWPYSYFGDNVDDRVTPKRPELVAQAVVPEYALGTHTGSLGLAFYTANALPTRFIGGAFVAQHGSWNRKPRSGYQVIFIPFNNNVPEGAAEEVLTGFISSDGKAFGRPVGLTVDQSGALLVADDVGQTIWRVQRAE